MRRQQIITANNTQVKRYAQYSLDAIRFAAHCVNDMLKDLLKKDPKNSMVYVHQCQLAAYAATDVVIVSYYNTDFIRCIALDYSTQQVYEQKRYLQAWDK